MFKQGSNRRAFVASLVPVGAILLQLSSLALAGDVTWTGGAANNSWWTDGANWDGGQIPTSSDNVFINQGHFNDAAYVPGTSIEMNSLEVSGASGSGTELLLDSGDYSVNLGWGMGWGTIGNGAGQEGRIQQAGGSVNADNIAIGKNGGTGVYDLSQSGGNASVNVFYLDVGTSGNGSFNLTDGNVSVSNNLTVGSGFGGQGEVNQSGGVTTAGSLWMSSWGGQGTYNMDGGILGVTNMNLGSDGGGTARFNQTDGWVDSTWTTIGLNSEARYDQDGGTHYAGTMSIGGGGANSTYDLSAGDLHSNNVYLSGNPGESVVFIQTGGDHEVSGNLRMSGKSSYIVAGGTLDADEIALFGAGSEVIQDGGVVTTHTLDLAAEEAPLESSMYLLSGGTLNVTGSIIQSDANGNGMLELYGGTLNYSGDTPMDIPNLNVYTGILEVSGNGGFNPVITLSGGELRNNSLVAQSTEIQGTGGRISGNGTFTSVVTVGGSRILAPGNSPGMTTFGGLTWTDGGSYEWEINDFTGTAGNDPGWDVLDVDGAWDISGLSMGGFNIDVLSLTLANVGGDAANFNDASAYSFGILSYDSLVGSFDSSLFNLDLSGFTNAYAGSWFLSLDSGNQQLVLNYGVVSTDVPVGGMLWLMLIGLVGLSYRVKI